MAAHWNGEARTNVLAHLCHLPVSVPVFLSRRYCSSLTMLRLTSAAMAELAIQRLVPAQLIRDFSTMAARFVFDFEAGAVFVDAVGGAGLPFMLALGGG